MGEFLEPTLRVSLIFILLYLLPGYLTARILQLGVRYSRVQVGALAFGVGFGEALLMGQVLVLLRAPTWTLALGIAALAAVKLGILIRRRLRSARNFPPQSETAAPSTAALLPRLNIRLPLLVQAGIALAGLMVLIVNAKQLPVYTYTPGDSWYYLQVQQQFSHNPGAWNVQPNITAPGTNERLLWSSYLYNRALLVDASQTDAMITHQRDGIPILYFTALIVAAAVGRELLRERQFAWLAAFLQIGLLSALTGDQNYFTVRIAEDKFFSFFIFIPLVLLVLARLLRTDGVTTRGDALLFGFLSISMMLIHVVNLLMVFVVAIPLIGYRALRTLLPARNSAQMRRWLLLCVWLGVLLVYPLLMQTLLARSQFVSEGMVAARSIGLDYYVPYAWGYARGLPEFVTSLGLLCVIGAAALWRKDDLAAQFVSAISITILLLLWVPPFAALGALAMTTSQNWRIFMLLPLGYGWAWLAVEVWKLVEAHILKRFSGGVRGDVLRAVYGAGVVVVLVLGWGWIGRVPDRRPPDTAVLPPETVTFLEQHREQVGAGTVLTTESFSVIVPSFWWDAQTLYFGSGALQPERYAELRAVMRMEEGADPPATFAHYAIDYLLLSESLPLSVYIREEWDCCELLAEMNGLVLYQVRAQDGVLGTP